MKFTAHLTAVGQIPRLWRYVVPRRRGYSFQMGLQSGRLSSAKRIFPEQNTSTTHAAASHTGALCTFPSFPADDGVPPIRGVHDRVRPGLTWSVASIKTTPR